ncbi:MAG: glycosyltransferase [Planctomycetaceae bacterium]|nr:glycosyltransferase [Planctomycetaceae bacterium]
MSLRASILIAAHNEGSCLRKTVLSALAAAVGVDAELLVADDASTDGSPEDVAHEFPRVKFVRHTERRGASPTKHLAATHARGDVLVFLDGHTHPEPTALRRLIEDVEATDGDAVVTPAVPHLDVAGWVNSRTQVGHGYALTLRDLGCRWVSRKSLKEHRVGRRTLYESPALIGCALAISRRLYEQLWGFDAQMRSWGVEDLDFGLKAWLAGHPILHDPDAVVGHRFRQSFDNFTVPTEHLWANQLRMARKHFTDSTWSVWVQAFRRRHERCGCSDPASRSPSLNPRPSTLNPPQGPWALAWETFQEDRASVEQERAYLLSRRVHDEFWYAERFGLDWPRLEGGMSQAYSPVGAGKAGVLRNSRSVESKASSAVMFSAQANESSPSPEPSPSPVPSPSPEPSPTPPPDPTTCPITLEEGFGVGWEGGTLDFYFSASSPEGDITTYEVDVDDDETFDGATSHDERIEGGLIQNLAGTLLGSPMDDGEYTARVRVSDSADNACDFEFPVYVGNVPPAIEILADTQGDTTADFPMTVVLADPGDDDIRTVSIAWGDGSMSALSPTGGATAHRYSVDGEYVATVTVTDEDGEWSRDHHLNIGNQNAPLPPESFPKIVGAVATINPSTQAATLTITAIDASGNPVPNIAWDLNGDDLFLDATGPSVTLTPQPGSALPFVATVRATDLIGNTAEALFAFAAEGPQEPQATGNTYREYFKKATPDLPDDWKVHHTKQRALADRYLRERGINVHDKQYLRGVPPSVHVTDITPAQGAWWRQQAKRFGNSVERAYAEIQLAEVEAFEQRMDAQYRQWWISSGTNQKAEVDAIVNDLKSSHSKFVTEKASRWRHLEIGVAAFALFSLISDSAMACHNIANHSPQQLDKWEIFRAKYDSALDSAARLGHVRQSQAWDLKDAFINYARSLSLDSDALDKIDILLLRQIQLTPGIIPD